MKVKQQDLFPTIEPYVKGMLSLGDGHQMYWEQSGNPNGWPVIFLHGGPGAGASPTHRRFFDPIFYRIIIFDQRGAGRSLPLANLSKNTTYHLIEDMEKLRHHLNIKKWLLFGGSWGSTLALAYGIKYKKQCSGFILRGIFLGDTREIDWFLYGIRNIYPEPWKNFVGFLSKGEQNNIIDAYYRRLVDTNPLVHMPAAEAWCQYEKSCSVMLVDFKETRQTSGFNKNYVLALAKIEAYYFKNSMFLDDGYILCNLSAIHDIPATIIQGRYDMICPIISADNLAMAWTAASYVIVPNAGHSALEKGNLLALVKATEDFKLLLINQKKTN